MDIKKAWYWADLAYRPEDLPAQAQRMRHGHDSGFWIMEGETLIVSMMGTGTLQGEAGFADWLSNINAFDLNRNHVHDGFDTACQPFMKDLRTVFDTFSFKNILWTGHSRGGALAGVMAFHFALPSDVITFGAPKQGDQTFANTVNLLPLNWINVINGNDCVPTYPPGDYVHAGKTVVLPIPFWQKLPLTRRYWRIKNHLRYAAALEG